MPCSVSTSRSSNRTGGFPASGSRTRMIWSNNSCFRPREVARSPRQPYQTEGLVQVLVRVLRGTRTGLLALLTQPPAKPSRGVGIHGAIGFADRSQAEVIRPARQATVETCHQLLVFQPEKASVGQLVQRVAEFLHSLFRRACALIRRRGFRRIAPSKRVAQQLERLHRHATTLRLSLLDRQFQPFHHVPHGGRSLFRRAA